MDFFDVVAGRHSFRDFADRSVEREVLERAIAAAVAAPSAMNSQPWRFHVCTGATRQRVGEIVAQATSYLAEYMDVLGPERYEDAVRWYSSLGDAPVLVVVSAPVPAVPAEALNIYLSVGAAIENMLLALTAQGLGACNITFATYVKDELGAAVGTSEGCEVVAIVAVGYPGDVPPSAPEHQTDVTDWLG